MKNSLLTLIVCWVGIGWSFAQTTITTNHVSNNGNGSVTFNVHNTNAYDIIITDISCHLNSSATNALQLLYRTTPVNDNAAPWDGGTVGAGQNGWILAGSATLSNTNTSNGIVPAISGMSLTVPAGATYGMGFSGTAIQYMDLSAVVNTFSADGVELLTGDGISWGGPAYPATPVNYIRGFIGGITFIPAVPCTAPPTAGTATASSNPVCPSTNTTLTLTGGSGGTGTTYQWQSSPDGVTYTNIPGATNSALTVNPTTTTYYQAIVTCTGMSTTSAPVNVTISPFMNCYCNSIPVNPGDEDIYSVTVNGGSTNALYAGANNCTAVAPGPGSILDRYSNFRTLPAITSVATGQTVNFSFTQDECNGATYYGNGVAIWIDFNQNGSFSDAGEQVYVENSTSIGPRTVNGTFTVPGGAIPGNTVMRIICAEGYAGTGLTPCMEYGYGETEDHMITILCPTLAGPTSLDEGVCSGNAATLDAVPSTTFTTISWWTAAVGGTQLATTPSYTTPAILAPTAYYVQEDFPGCTSSPRDQVNVTVVSVDAVLTPVNVSCNALNNGSFTLGTVNCGTAPFMYSVNGGAFAAIPSNLAPGTYSIVMRDATMALSGTYQIVITQPGAPTALTATNISYFNALLGWTPQGNETTWTVEYGPAGFTPGSPAGTIITNATNGQPISGLLANTNYQFYVAAGCAPGSAVAGPYSFSTDPGFTTFDNACGPGFTDISGTGTALNLGDDGEALVTSSFPLSFQGVTTNQINISNNGYIYFNGVNLSAWNIDLDSEEGNVYHQTVTIGGVNYFVVQWENRPKYPYAAGTGQNATFQLMVSQATGEIWYLYEDVVFGGSQSGNDYGLAGTIAASGPTSTVTISVDNATYLTNNSCAHIYNELCPNVSGMTTIAFQDDAILDWNPGLYGEGNWTLIYGLSGFDPTVPGQAIDTFDLVASDASFGGTLQQLTEYDVYIYSECQADNLTSTGFFVTFTTLPFCKNPSAITAATDVDSLETAWTWTPYSSDYTIDHFNIQYGFAGFDPNSGTIVTANGINNADTIFNAAFVAGGVYELYIQAVCDNSLGGTDTSTYVGPIMFTMPLTNDDACGAQPLNANGTVYTFTNANATVATGEAAIAPPATGAQTSTGWTNSTLNNTTWFTFVAPASGSVRVNNTAINYNGQAAVYRATNCANFTTFNLVAANDNAIGGTSVAPNYTICGLTPLATYYLMHDGFNGTTGTYSISITPIVLEAGTAAAVSPICAGESIDLFTTVTGNNPGGVWSSGIAAVNANISGSNFNSTGLAYQVFNLQYRITDGCAFDSILTMVHVFAPSNAGQDGTITACLNEPVDLLAGLQVNADLNGDWYNAASTLLPNSQVSASPTAGQFLYRYIAGNGVCDDDTAYVSLNVVNTCNFLSVNEELFNGVSVYPNPSEGVVFISSDATEAFDYVITDAKGRVVSAVTAGIKGAQTTEINLSAAETGIYFIRLTNATAEKTFRVVIQ